MTAPEEPTEPPRPPSRKEPPGPPVDAEVISERLTKRASTVRTTTEQIDETEKEQASRLRVAEKDAEAVRAESKAAADHRRKLEICAFWGFFFVAIVAVGACIWVLVDKEIDPQDKAWVGPTLTLILGGFMGFLTGRTGSHMVEK